MKPESSLTRRRQNNGSQIIRSIINTILIIKYTLQSDRSAKRFDWLETLLRA
jgi:hypothetical protein